MLLVVVFPKNHIILFLFLIPLFSIAQINVDDYYCTEDGANWAIAINKAIIAIDEVGHGSVEFNGSKKYTITTPIYLPKKSKIGKRSIILNGNGCILKTNRQISIFYRIPLNQKEALNEMMSTRFVFNDFTIVGGTKGIELGATYGSSINRCTFIGQQLAAVDIQFGLNTIISHCHSNGAKKDNFILRSGSSWGGTDNNSQSNHSIIESCRVFAKAGANSAFKILASGGCVIRDCISEGNSDLNYSIIIDNQASNTVRLNRIENLHLEHKAKIAGIYINSKGITTIDGLFYQTAYENYKLILSGKITEQITLMNMPHYVSGTIIRQNKTGSGTAWKLLYCHKSYYKPENWQLKEVSGNYLNKLPFYFSGEGYRYQIDKSDYK